MKNLFYLMICFIILIYFFVAPSDAFAASQNGILLWFNQILPTLLPFSIISNLLIGSNLFSAIRAKFFKNKAWIPEEIFIILCGFLFGFPIGSKLTADFYSQQILSKKRAQILCVFTNNLSPVFVSSYVCTSLFHRPDWIIPAYCCLYLPALSYGIFMLHAAPSHAAEQKKPVSRFCIDMQLMDTGIINSFYTLIKLCGYIMIFSILSQCIASLSLMKHDFFVILLGNLEVTNGITQLSLLLDGSPYAFVFMILLLSIGGISGWVQTGSMLAKTDLSMKTYVLHKCIIAAMSTCAAFLISFLLFPLWKS